MDSLGFANGIMTLYIVFLQTVKKVESYEQINIQSIILSEAQCAKEATNNVKADVTSKGLLIKDSHQKQEYIEI